MAVVRLDSGHVDTDCELACGGIGARGAGNTTTTWNVRADTSYTTGKLFFEYIFTRHSNSINVGIGCIDSTVAPTQDISQGGTAGEWTYNSFGRKNSQASGEVGYGSAYTSGDVISVCWDVANGNMWFAKNGKWQGGATDAEIAADTTTNAAFTDTFSNGTTPWYPAFGHQSNADNEGNGIIANFGQYGASMPIPSGYAFPDTETIAFPPGPPASGNGWQRFNWRADKGYELGRLTNDTDNTIPSPLINVGTDGKTLCQIVGDKDSVSTDIIVKHHARTAANLDPTRKYYWEYLITDTGSALDGGTAVGFASNRDVRMATPAQLTTDIPFPGQITGTNAHQEGASVNLSTGAIRGPDSSDLGTLGTISNLDVIDVAIDFISGKFWFGLNGSWKGAGDPVAGTGWTGIIEGRFDIRPIVRFDHAEFGVASADITLQSEDVDYDDTKPSGYENIPDPPFPGHDPIRIDRTDHGSHILFNRHHVGFHTASLGGSGNIGASNKRFTTEKVIFDVIFDGFGTFSAVGIVDQGLNLTAATVSEGVGESTNGWAYIPAGNSRTNATNSAYGSSWTAGDIITCAFDAANGHIWFAKNGIWQNGATSSEIAAGTTTNAAHVGVGTAPYRLCASNFSSGSQGIIFNFGQFGQSFSDIPAGYAYPDTDIVFPPGPPVGNKGWERFNWFNGAFVTTTSIEPSPFMHVFEDNKDITLTERGLVVARTAADFEPTGKYYFEFQQLDITSGGGTFTETNFGFSSDAGHAMDDLFIPVSGQQGGGVRPSSFTVYGNGHSTLGDGGSIGDGDIIGFAVDVAAGKWWCHKNGVYIDIGGGVGDPATGVNPVNDGALFTDPGDLRVMVSMHQMEAGFSPPCDAIRLYVDDSELRFDIPTGFSTIPAPPATHFGNGVSNISIATTAAGREQHHRADGVSDISIEQLGVGSNPNRRAVGNQGGIFILTSGSGSNTSRHGAGQTDITIVTDASGQAFTIHGDGSTDISISTTGAGKAGGISGLNTPLPALTSNGRIEAGGTAVLDRENLPRLTVNGFLQVSLAAFGSPLLPELGVNGLIEGEQIVTLPKLGVNGTLLVGPAIKGTVTLPKLSVNAIGVNDSPALAEGTLGALQVEATGVSGAAMSGSPALPRMKTNGDLVPENIITGNLTLPLFGLDPKQPPVSAGSAGGGTVILPLLRILGQIANASSLTQTAWAMNTESFETSNYLNYNFASLVSYAEQPYGVTASGIFLLEGDDDDGVQINAEFLTGVEDLTDENLKEVAQLYLEYEGGNLVLRLFPDGQVRVREYPVERQSNATGVKHARFKGARGLRSRSYQLGLKNLGGADFSIDKLGLLIRTLSRKTRKN